MYCTPDIRPDLLTIRISKTPWRNDLFSISVAVPQNFTIHRLSSAGPDRVPKILDPPWVWLADGIYHLLTEFREIWLPGVSVILFQFDHYQWCIRPHCIAPPPLPRQQTWDLPPPRSLTKDQIWGPLQSHPSLLLTSGGHHWRPVQTARISRLFIWGPLGATSGGDHWSM